MKFKVLPLPDILQRRKKAHERQEACPGPRRPEAEPSLELEFCGANESENICLFRASAVFPPGSILDSWSLANLACLQ